MKPDRSKHAEFIVRLRLPYDTSYEYLRRYIETAILSEAGWRDPEIDPVAHLDRNSVQVTRRVNRRYTK